ncbi:MAG TPA: GspH/FimT family pseudopilin [Thermoanaerobaculia bacterium]|nr:GspH/FimT family pseudopilin [Thermoanaerobaculia bacterium]
MQHRRNAGYSLTEILVVVAIIGVLSLITVPAFMNFQRASVFKSAMRIFSTDLRAARAAAIQQSYDVRVELTTGAEGPTTKEYRFFASRDGVNWTPLTVRKASSKVLEGPVWLESATNLRDIETNSKPDIVFHANGQADVNGTAPAAVVVMATNWQNIFSNRYNITITRSGQIRASTSQCNDGIDNDNDGFIDFGPDPQCSALSDNSET